MGLTTGRPIPERPLRFAFQLLLLSLLMTLSWLATPWGRILIFKDSGTWHHQESIPAWTQFLVCDVALCFALIIVYYGTSFEVTPFRIARPLLSQLREFVSINSRLTPGATLTRLGRTGALTDSSSTESGDSTQEGQEKETLFTPNVDEILHSSARASRALAGRMEARINAYLTLGVIVATVGVGVWWRSFSYGGGFADKSLDTTHLLVGILPRITILAFIEILAGFFLRQYRIGVEDLKYFLELTRRSEAKRIAYSILDRLGDKDAQVSFARVLLEEKSDSRLAPGETTTALHAMEKERNEFLNVAKAFSEQAESFSRLMKK